MAVINFKDKWTEINIIILFFGMFFFGILGGFRFGLVFLMLSILIFILVGLSNNGKFRFGIINSVYLILTGLFSFSVLYAFDPSYTLDPLLAVFSVNFLMFLIYNYCIDKAKIIRVISYFLYVSLIFSLMNAIKTPLTAREMFYGGVNPVGFAMFVSIILVIWMSLNKRYVFLYFIPIYFYVLFITSSQKSLLSLFIVFLIYMALLIYKLKIKIFFKIATSLILVGLIAFALLSRQESLRYAFTRTTATVETLLTGKKVQRAAGGSDGEGLRPFLKEQGWVFVKKSPLIGYGINNYRPLLKESFGFETYSHNTPIELAISVGILGIIIYYSIFVILFVKLFRNYRRTKNIDNLFLIACLPAIIIIGWYMQLYFDIFAHFFLILMLCYVQIRTVGFKSGAEIN